MKRRWFAYIVVGVLFGVFDFYFLNFIPKWATNSIVLSQIIGILLTFGVWLVPSLPIVLYETKISRSRMLSALANVLTWSIAVIVYYVTNVVQLAIGGLNQPWMSFSHHKSLGFWSNWSNLLATYIWGHILEWSVVAVVGGFIIGFLISSIYLVVRMDQK